LFHLLKKTTEEGGVPPERGVRRAFCEEISEQTILDESVILRKQAKKYLVDEVGATCCARCPRRRSRPSKCSASELFGGFSRHIVPFFEQASVASGFVNVSEPGAFRIEELSSSSNGRGANEIVPVRVICYAVSVACEKQWRVRQRSGIVD